MSSKVEVPVMIGNFIKKLGIGGNRSQYKNTLAYDIITHDIMGYANEAETKWIEENAHLFLQALQHGYITESQYVIEVTEGWYFVAGALDGSVKISPNIENAYPYNNLDEVLRIMSGWRSEAIELSEKESDDNTMIKVKYKGKGR